MSFDWFMKVLSNSKQDSNKKVISKAKGHEKFSFTASKTITRVICNNYLARRCIHSNSFIESKDGPTVPTPEELYFWNERVFVCGRKIFVSNFNKQHKIQYWDRHGYQHQNPVGNIIQGGYITVQRMYSICYSSDNTLLQEKIIKQSWRKEPSFVFYYFNKTIPLLTSGGPSNIQQRRNKEIGKAEIIKICSNFWRANMSAL